MVTVQIPETQLVEWVQHLTPTTKRLILRALISTLDEYEALVDYGQERAQALAAERGLNWELLDDQQRTVWLDTLLHERAP